MGDEKVPYPPAKERAKERMHTRMQGGAALWRELPEKVSGLYHGRSQLTKKAVASEQSQLPLLLSSDVRLVPSPRSWLASPPISP